MTYRVLLISICCFAGIISAWLLNVLVIEPLVIPDECYYHTHEVPFLIKVFYDFPSSEGGHPIPSASNVYLTHGVGSVTGFVIAWRKLNREGM